MSYMLRMLRRDDRRRMVDRCNVTRGTHPNVTTVHASQPCVVRPAHAGGRSEIEQGGAALMLNYWTVRLPHATDIKRGDVVTVTACREDPMLVGEWMTVAEVTWDSEQTSRLVTCERSTS